MNHIIRILSILIVLAFLLPACSSQQCTECGDTPTKAFKNTATNEKEYYCQDCYSHCFVCNGKATKHYVNMLENIVFICNDCYEDWNG